MLDAGEGATNEKENHFAPSQLTAGDDAGTSSDASESGLETQPASLQVDAGSLAADASRDAAPVAAEKAAPPVAVSPMPASPAFEVTVRSRSRAELLRRSALAVTVVELDETRRGAADLGEALARVEGVAVRRSGGLGSDQRFSLAGLEGEQVRFSLDGVPLDLAG
jgi:outer membrane receptor for Fe3+-dicitrate